MTTANHNPRSMSIRMARLRFHHFLKTKAMTENRKCDQNLARDLKTFNNQVQRDVQKEWKVR